MYAIKAFT